MANITEINDLLGYFNVSPVQETEIVPQFNSEVNRSQGKSGQIDAQSERIIAGLDPSMHQLAKDFLLKAREEGIELIVTSGYRSPANQSRLYEQGRSTKGAVVTNAKPGRSKHNFGVAFDVAPVNNGRADYSGGQEIWDRIGSIGKGMGLKWGGDWAKPDLPHFEHPTHEMRDLLMGKARTQYSGENLKYIARQARMDSLNALNAFSSAQQS